MTEVDLHAHSSASDGSDAPADLVARAGAAGVRVLALTDHDTVSGIAAARAAGAAAGVEVIAGCELTAELGGRVVHLLAYGEGLLVEGALDEVGATRRLRARRNRDIGERLRALTGVGYEEAAALAGRAALSRAHFAGALVARGVVADVPEAFDRYLSNGRPAYMPAPALAGGEVVRLVHRLGGVVVLAHPGRLDRAEQDEVVAHALDAGVDGIEVWHPQHDPGARRRWSALAERRGLLTTGGSDYHGVHKPGVRLGIEAVPHEAAAHLTATVG